MSSRSDSNQITRDYFDSILLETRYWDSDLPSTKMELYGETFETPIMTAALSHLHEICDNAMAEFGKGVQGMQERCTGLAWEKMRNWNRFLQPEPEP